jgi:aminoglycoside 6'-N-acetyltransferase I
VGDGSLAVRRLTAHDETAFLELRQAALRDSPFAFAASPDDDPARAPGFVRAALTETDQALFGAFDAAGDLIGITGVYRDRLHKARHKCHVWGVYVAPRARGRGIARRLVQAALDFAASQDGVTHVHLTVSDRAPAALALYRSLGFAVWGSEPAGLRVGAESADEHHLVAVVRPRAVSGGRHADRPADGDATRPRGLTAPQADAAGASDATVTVRPAQPADAAAWAALRAALWPEAGAAELAAEAERFFRGGVPNVLAVLLAVDAHESVVGFAELSIRRYAEGCVTDRVAYLEGWYVAPAVRRRGVGAALIAGAERWARAQGCTEFASDADLDNAVSAAAHRALGFAVSGLVRCFRKLL